MSGNLPGESHAPQVQIPAIVFCVIAPIFVGIRFWSRIRASNSLGADDWTILGSLLFSLAVSVLMLKSCDYGFGQHIKNLTPYNKMMALKLFYVAQAFYKVNINMTKGSILLLYLRIFVQRVFRIICWVMLVIVLSYMIVSTAASLFQCTPVARAWDKTIPGTCINITMNWYANAGFSIATDVIILVLPMPIIHSLRLQTNQKVGLMFIFGLGGFVVVTSSLRMTTIDFSSSSPDTTYDIISSLWTIIESNIGILCACLPCCRPLLHLLFPSTFPALEPGAGASPKRPQYQSTSSSKSSSTRKSSKARTATMDWVPPRRGHQDVLLSSVHAARNGSEEYILRLPLDEDGKGEELRAKSIHMVTKFEVVYNVAEEEEEEEGV